MKSPEVAIIGVDGATFSLITPWAEQGKLPHFARLMKDGSRGILQSTIPPVTAPAWTSFMTGKNPGKHGLYDFIEPQPDSYGMRYTCASSRKAKTLWRIASDNNKTVGVMNVPMTYPPEEVNGYMISGMDTPDETCPFIYPPALKKELWRERGGIRLDINHLGYMQNDRKRDKVLDDLIRLEKERLEVILYLLDKHPVDVFMAVFTATDQVQHHFWHYMDPAHPQYDAKGAKRYSSAILKVYQCIDEIIGVLLDAFSADTTFVLMSDHGFKATSSRYLYLNRYLEEKGFLSVNDAQPKPGVKLLFPLIHRIDHLLRSLLSSRTKRMITRLLPWARASLESYLTFSCFEWSKTKAYACEISTTSPNIWVNLRGRNPHGIVEPDEYDSLLGQLRDELLSLKDPADGSQVIPKIYRREEIYTGDEIDKAPDLILSWWDGTGFTARPSYPRTSREDPVLLHVSDFHAGFDWGGIHAMEGVILLYGKNIKKGKAIEGANIVDIAPTALHLLGLAVPNDMDGRVLVEAIEEDALALNPVMVERAVQGERTETESPYSKEDEEKIRQRLKDLGYLS